MLVAVRAEAQVLHRPWQARVRWREWQQLADHFHRLAGLAVCVDLAWLCLGKHLSSGGGIAQAVTLLAHRPAL